MARARTTSRSLSSLRRPVASPGSSASRLTPEVAILICNSIRLGNYLETAAAAAGIGGSTLRQWLARGTRACQRLEDGEPLESPEDRVYLEFAQEVRKAEAVAEERAVRQIDLAANFDWKAAAWRLSRKSPDRWGDRSTQQVEVTGRIHSQVSGQVAHVHAHLTAGDLREMPLEDRRKLLELIRARKQQQELEDAGRSLEIAGPTPKSDGAAPAAEDAEIAEDVENAAAGPQEQVSVSSLPAARPVVTAERTLRPTQPHKLAAVTGLPEKDLSIRALRRPLPPKGRRAAKSGRKGTVRKGRSATSAASSPPQS